MYQTLKTMFHQLSKHLKFRQKYSTACRIFNSFLSVWISRWNTGIWKRFQYCLPKWLTKRFTIVIIIVIVNYEVSWMQCKVVTCTTFLGAVPTFLKEPTSKTTAIKGSTATYDCQIDVSQPSYHWLKDGGNITKGSISLSGSVSSLQIDNLAFSDSGNYSCVATDIQSSQSGERTGVLVVKGMLLILKLFRDCNTFRSAMWVR